MAGSTIGWEFEGSARGGQQCQQGGAKAAVRQGDALWSGRRRRAHHARGSLHESAGAQQQRLQSEWRKGGEWGNA